MKQIKAFTSDSVVNYNVLTYKIILSSQFPSLSDVWIEMISNSLDEHYKDLLLFVEQSSIKIIIRNILIMNNLMVEGSFDFKDHERVVNMNMLILGPIHNYPINRDFHVDKLLNKDYNFSDYDLANIGSLYKKQKLLFDIKSVVHLESEKISQPDVKRIFNYKTVHPSISNQGKITDDYMEIINAYISTIFSTELDQLDTFSVIHGLADLGLIEVITAVIRNDEDYLKSVLDRYTYIAISNKIESNKYIQYMIQLSELNQLLILSEREIDNHIEIKYIVDRYKIQSVPGLIKYVNKKTYKKLNEILEKQIKISTKPCKTHTKIIHEFIPIRTGQRRITKRKAKELIDEIKEISEERDNLYFCKSCHQEILCNHVIELVMNIYSEKDQRKMNKVLADFSLPIKDKIYYCKYCNQKIFKDQTIDFITNEDFEMLQKNRANFYAAKSSQFEINSQMYNGIYAATGQFKFKYEFSMKNLSEHISNVITPPIIKLYEANPFNITDYDIIKVYSYTYTIMYIGMIWMNDRDNISIPGFKGTTLEELAAHFMPIISFKYKSIVANSKIISHIIKDAFHKLKNEYKAEIQFVNEEVSRRSILNDVIYSIMYNIFCVGHDNATRGTLMPSIIKSDVYKKLTIANYYTGFNRIPEQTIQHEKNLYSFIVDFSDPKNHIYRDQKIGRMIVGYKSGNVYDPEIFNYFIELGKKLNQSRKVSDYFNYYQQLDQYTFSISYAANYIYDNNGNFINWEIEVDKKKSKLYKNEAGFLTTYVDYPKSIKWYMIDDDKKIYLDKMGIAKPNQITKLIETRNKVIKFKSAKFIKKKLLSSGKIKTSDSKYSFIIEEKLYGLIKKISSKYTTYQIKFLGRTRRQDPRLIRSGNIEPAEIISTDDPRLFTIYRYAELLISTYLSMLNSPNKSVNAAYYSKANVNPTKFDSKKYKNFIDPIPSDNQQTDNEIFQSAFYRLLSYWKPQDVFLWVLKYILVVCDKIYNDLPKLGKIFVENYFETIMSIEKFGYLNSYIDSADIDNVNDMDAINGEDIENEAEAEEDQDLIEDEDFDKDDDNYIIND